MLSPIEIIQLIEQCYEFKNSIIIKKEKKRFYNILGVQASNFADLNTLEGIQGNICDITTLHERLCHDLTTMSSIRHVSTPCCLTFSCTSHYRDSIGLGHACLLWLVSQRAPCNRYIVLNGHCDHICTPTWTNIK